MFLTNFYIRVINLNEDHDSLERDLEPIQRIVAEFEEASLGREPELHGRGGYALYVNCDENDLETLMEALAKAGYRPCIQNSLAEQAGVRNHLPMAVFGFCGDIRQGNYMIDIGVISG